MSATADTPTDRERLALAHGQARMYHGRVIPIIRGGDETDEEKAAREAREAAEAEAAKAKTFTQADVDRIVQERVARVKTTPPDDYEDLKAAAAKLAEIEAANKTELEKAQAAAAKAEAEREKLVVQMRDTTLRSSLLAEAAKADRKVADPEAAVALLTSIDKDLLDLDSEGNPTDIAKAMDSLLEKRPHLVASAGGARGGSADQGARGGGGNQLTADALKNMSPEEIVKARKEGRLATVLGAS